MNRFSDDRAYYNKFYADENDLVYGSSNLLMQQTYGNMIGLLIKENIITPDSNVLSLGCGSGTFEIKLAKHVKNIAGVDVSEVGIKKANLKARKESLNNVIFEPGDIKILSYPPNSFNVILAVEVLHHMSDEEIASALKSSLLCLKEGGAFVCFDPSSRRIINIFKPLFKKQISEYHTPEERELDIKKIKEMLKAAGFIDIKMRYFDFFMSSLGFLLPRVSARIARFIYVLDRLLVSTPGICYFSSGFAGIAYKSRG